MNRRSLWLGLSMAIVLVLIRVAAPVVARPAATAQLGASNKQPPFNGSIFGKRSLMSSALDATANYMDRARSDQQDMATGNSPLFRQEAMVELALEQCLNLRSNIDYDPVTVALCGRMLADRIAAASRLELVPNQQSGWFVRLIKT